MRQRQTDGRSGAWRVAIVSVFAFAICGDPVTASARTVVPISQTTLSDGTIRYSIPVTIGDTKVAAQLDTGSTGLRFLPSAVAADQYTPDGKQMTSLFGSGVMYKGPGVLVQVGIGDLQSSAPLPAELIDNVDCASGDPHCPSSKIGARQYRIGGDGLAREGFAAIIGIGLRTQLDVVNPLSQLSRTGRWIVELPAIGSSTPGKLIVDPSPGETDGFHKIQLAQSGTGWSDDAVPVCLVNEDSGAQICGGALIDSGNSCIAVKQTTPADRQSFPTGASAVIDLGDSQAVQFHVGAMAGTDVNIGSSDHHQTDTTMNLGFFPFLAYAVYYDWNTGIVGLRDRRR